MYGLMPVLEDLKQFWNRKMVMDSHILWHMQVDIPTMLKVNMYPVSSKWLPLFLESNIFEVYLLGHPVTVYTDHHVLVSAFISQLKGQTKGLLASWYLQLARFILLMKLEYKPGRANVVADGLSQAPAQAPVEDSGTVGVMVNQVTEDPVLAKYRRSKDKMEN